ncbi:hypothetical protein CAEBREN_06202 [Caenorhabditis brenneri]|uniref:Uncharacterized protein n=1 Tax=Caenorhabditis brenneri TaxID=135651 RepID=G0M8C0_CAEBE|nr:hypothetical protein CAEBREN_06202 [Caenorhabditis brenneri]
MVEKSMKIYSLEEILSFEISSRDYYAMEFLKTKQFAVLERSSVSKLDRANSSNSDGTSKCLKLCDTCSRGLPTPRRRFVIWSQLA